MYHAPVLIPTLCRFDHFKACIESLAGNTCAKDTEVFIGVDHPTKEGHWEGYKEICRYLEETEFPFLKVNVYKRSSNYGVEKNAEELAAVAEQKYDRYIFTEDDNVFSAKFLEYMNTMLEKIKDSEEIYGVCGYSYPVKYSGSNSDACSVFVKTAFPEWGYGTFFDKRNKFKEEYTHEFLINSLKSGSANKLIKKFGNIYYTWYINRVCDKKVEYNDIDVQIYEVITGKYSVMPCKSLSRNIGWDGSGINCKNEVYDFSSQELYEGEISDMILSQDDKHEKEIWQFISSLNKIDIITIIKTRIKYLLVKTGIKR